MEYDFGLVPRTDAEHLFMGLSHLLLLLQLPLTSSTQTHLNKIGKILLNTYPFVKLDLKKKLSFLIMKIKYEEV